MFPSISENNGIGAISIQDQQIYSVGISTAGVAEMRMAIVSPKREITATTIDSEGAIFATKRVEEAGLSDQITIKVENVAGPLPYSDECFDFVYARLVLHYLSRKELVGALQELYRVSKPGARIFVVVRSKETVKAQNESAIEDPNTGMTTYTSNSVSYRRYFHSVESIQSYLKSAGFHIKYAKLYKERLCADFQRKRLEAQDDILIEVLAGK